MTRKNFYVGALILGALATITLAVTLTFSISRFHRRPTPSVNSPVVAQATRSTAAESSGGPKEGIKVHGHWTIEVRNPDGTLVTHREFENGLGTNAALILGQVLQRSSKPGEWRIFLASDVASEAPCTRTNVQFTSCVVYEPASQAPSSQEANAFKTLTFRPGDPSLGEDPAATVFTGNATAGRDGVINRVGTNFAKCPVDTIGVCVTDSFSLFTTTTLATPVNVVLGQIVQVKVVISFS